ncbi:MAG: hypothetical protein ABEJ31_02595 [Haloarculaceae archaeon]
MGLFDAVRGLVGGGGSDAADVGTASEHGVDAARAFDREPTPTVFRNAAIDAVQTFEAYDLDFSPASLSRLDALADEERTVLSVMRAERDDGGEAAAERHTALTIQAGSYLGETLVRAFDGEWRRADDGGWHVALSVDGADAAIDVFDVAGHSFAEASLFGDLAGELGYEPPAEPAAEPDAADDGTDTDDLEAVATEFADAWDRYGLDYSAPSLARLDDLANTEWEPDRFVGTSVGGEDMDSQIFTKLVKQLGGYYGETLVGVLGAEWRRPEGQEPTVAVPVGDDATTVRPFSTAAESLTGTAGFVAEYERLTADRPDAPAVRDANASAPADTDHGSPSAAADADDAADRGDARSAGPGPEVDPTVAEAEAARSGGSADGDGADASRSPDTDVADARPDVGDARADAADGNLEAADQRSETDETDRSTPGGRAEAEPTPAPEQAGEASAAEDGGASLDDVIPEAPAGDEELGTASDADAGAESAADAGGAETGDEATVTDVADELDVGDPAGRGDAVGATGDGGAGGLAPADLRDDAAAFAATWPGYDLDFSPASLARLDRLVADEYVAQNDPAALESIADAEPSFLAARAAEAGGYFADVLVREFGGEWHTEGAAPTLVVDGQQGRATVDPLAVAAACFRGEETFAAAYERVTRQVAGSTGGQPSG